MPTTCLPSSSSRREVKVPWGVITSIAWPGRRAVSYTHLDVYKRQHFKRFANLDDEAARALAHEYWKGINEPNLHENIRPTRARASLVLRKEADHKVQKVLLEDQVWDGGAETATWVSLSYPDGLPAGEYTLEVLSLIHI